MKIKALVIDDEPLSHEVIKNYSTGLNSLEITGYFTDALKAFDYLNGNPVDLIFLDVNMPKLSGIEFIKALKNPPMIILTTAYTEYAAESYELNVLDYLPKPFSLPRFLKAIQKAEQQFAFMQPNTTSPTPESIFIKSNKKTFQIQLNEITYIEGLGDYIKIFTDKTHFISNLTMKKMEELLPETTFFRVHKSFIVNIKKIIALEGNTVELPNRKIGIGNNYRQEFLNKIGHQIL